jgi:release factor glutamine methyltransferase
VSAQPRPLEWPATIEVHAPEGVYAPQRDTALLRAVAEARLEDGCGYEALDLCTGSGAVALSMAARGAAVTAVDIDPLAVSAARANAARNGLQLEVHLGDLFAAVPGRSFGLITCNPPYLPAPQGAECPRWDAGPDGRSVVDRVCSDIDRHLAPAGVLLLVQSNLTGIERTVGMLRGHGFSANVVADHRGPLGPVASARLSYLEHLLDEGRCERLVVLEARRV